VPALPCPAPGGLRSAARTADFDNRRSDADFLIEFEPGADPDMAGFLDVKEALEVVVGRSVDLVDRIAVEQSRNYLRRRQILLDAEPVYVAGCRRRGGVCRRSRSGTIHRKQVALSCCHSLH
jgi:predicted nucleotidyltransferase